MVDGTALKRGTKRTDGDAGASLESLSRTLEALESRLSGAGRAPAVPLRGPSGPPPQNRPSLADAVSQIVMRRQMGESGAASAPTRRPDAPLARPAQAEADDGGSIREQVDGLAGDLDSLRRENESFAVVAGVADELRAMEIEARDGTRNADAVGPRLGALRRGFDALRGAVGERGLRHAGAEAEIDRMDGDLAGLSGNGGDEASIAALRGELAEIRHLVAIRQSGRGEALPLGTPARGRAEGPKGLQQELERLRASFGSEAGGTDASADRRGEAAASEERLSALLKGEMNQLREKLETLASERSMRAVEERWSALEHRFASREVETTIAAMAARMEHLETTLARLPDTLPIGALESRIETLAAGIEAIAQRQQSDADADQFLSLEERLDEISEAIMSIARRPAADPAPLDRIETQVADLCGRVDALAADEAASLLAHRLDSFGEKFERLLAGQEEARIGTLDMEARLAGLSARLDEEVADRVDPELVRSLEAQIGRLSLHLNDPSAAPFAPLDAAVEERLGAIEKRLEEDREVVIASARAAADEAVQRMLEGGDRRQGEHVAQLSEALRSLEDLSTKNDQRMSGVVDAVHETLLKIVARLDQIEDEMLAAARAPGAPDDLGDDAPSVFDVPAAPAVPDPAEERAGRSGIMGALSRRFSARRQADVAAIEAPAAPAAPIAAAPSAEPVFEPQDVGDDPAPFDLSPDFNDPIVSQEANRPLEIGSGAPDIATLINRVRAQQREASAPADGEAVGKADYIAAARRHVMAAAAETDSLRLDEKREGQGFAQFGDAVSRRRKPILMAVGAVLLALMAMPLGMKLIQTLSADASDRQIADLSGREVEEVAAVVAPLPAPSAEAAAPAAPPADIAERPAASDPAVSVAAAPPPVDLLSPAAAQLAAAPEPAAGPADADSGFSGGIGPHREPVASGPNLAALAAAPLPEIPADIGTPALTAAATAGDPTALFEIGLRLMEGYAGEPNPTEAVRWFEASAGRGFAPAQYSLGTLHEKGNGVARDTIAARDWYTLAADQGNVRAMHNLAVLYATGIDGKSEPETAARWFGEAAAYGMRDSQYNLGILYARGAGVEQDMVESYKWFAVVAASGDKDAGDKRDEIFAGLSPQEQADAQARVAAWTPKARVESSNAVDVPAEWSEAPEHTASVDMTRAVRNIQAILGKLGYDAGAPDGVMGRRTSDAIRAFQADAGLNADGQISETLIRALLERKDA